jgi:hypothetical protein
VTRVADVIDGIWTLGPEVLELLRGIPDDANAPLFSKKVSTIA